jgi:hypothetical protein
VDAPDRRPPLVSVTRPDGSPVEQRDVLVSAPARRLGRRAVAGLVVGALLLAGAAVGAGVQQDREEQGRVALALLPTGGVESQVVWELTGRTALVRWRAEVRNDGRRPVTVVRADWAALREADAACARPAGAAPLLLTRLVRCADPQGEPAPTRCRSTSRRGRGPRDRPLPVARAGAGRARHAPPTGLRCGRRSTTRWRPAPDRRDVRAGTVVIAVRRRTSPTAPLRLAAPVVQEGLQVRALDPAGRPLALPLDLPPTAPAPPRSSPLRSR